eukprot:1726028-Rhodomonas_salina.2
MLTSLASLPGAVRSGGGAAFGANSREAAGGREEEEHGRAMWGALCCNVGAPSPRPPFSSGADRALPAPGGASEAPRHHP